MGSFCHCDPIAAAHVGSDYSDGKNIEIRKAFQDLIDNKARLKDWGCLWGVGAEQLGERQGCSVLKLSNYLLPSVLFGGEAGWYLEISRQNFSSLFCCAVHGWHSTGSHCQSSDQVLLLPLPAGCVENRLWQRRLWTFLLAWSQGVPEKLTSKATSINGITVLLGTTVTSLSFPLQHFQILFLSSSQYWGLFVCSIVTFSSPPPTDATFPFSSPTLCCLRALPGCTALPEESWHTKTDVINNVGSSPCSFPSMHETWLAWLQNLPSLISPRKWDTSRLFSRSFQRYLHFENGDE